jgi:hypothetical protein
MRGAQSPDRLWKALLLFALAAGPLRAVFSAVQLSSRSSSSARLIATFSLMEATGGVYLRYKNVPAALRWINFMNPYFYTIMGLIKIEFDHYQFPGGFSQDVVAHFGYDDFTLEQVRECIARAFSPSAAPACQLASTQQAFSVFLRCPTSLARCLSLMTHNIPGGTNMPNSSQVFWVLCMLFAIYTIVAFIAFRAVNSSKHVVDMSMEDNSRDTWGRRHGLKKGGAFPPLISPAPETGALRRCLAPSPHLGWWLARRGWRVRGWFERWSMRTLARVNALSTVAQSTLAR